MKRVGTSLFFAAVLGLSALCGQSSVVEGKTVYSNNFNSGNASLSEFVVAGKGPYSVDVVSGQLRINTSTPTPSKGYAAIHASKFAAPYSSTLKDNLGLVSWSFNVSNENGMFNNSFFFSLASDAPDSQVYTSTSYVFDGGGYVGDRMMLYCHSGPGSVKSIIDITNGMPNLPYKGSFRITYDPSTGRWSLYGICRGSSYFDPTSVSKLLGSNVDDTYTGLDLPYMCIGGSTTGSDYFDNVTVSVFPEPPVGLEIIGPNNVAGNSSAIYKAIAYYDNNSTRDITNLALWVVEPNTAANIDENGVLRTQDIVKHQSATILASYTEGDVTFDAEKAIDILAICPTGTALQFDGEDDYVQLPAGAADLGLEYATQSFSIEMWLKTTQSEERYLFDNYRYTLGNVSFRIDAGKIEWHIGKYRIGNYILFRSEASVNDGLWHHVACTWDGAGEASIFVDGNYSGSSTNPNLVGSLESGYPFLIGTRIESSGLSERFFRGTIDEVAIYQRALTAEEIRANMHRRLAGDEPGLVGYWDFDEGEGQFIYDLSGNGNDGQLGSTPDADESDPAWIDSDAPVSICSLYQIATLAADRAVERKTALLEELLAALAQEWAAYETLEELFESGDYGDLNKGDIVTAKQKIHSAIQHEEQSIDALEKSIEKLKDALSALGYEAEPPPM